MWMVLPIELVEQNSCKNTISSRVTDKVWERQMANEMLLDLECSNNSNELTYSEASHFFQEEENQTSYCFQETWSRQAQ